VERGAHSATLGRAVQIGGKALAKTGIMLVQFDGFAHAKVPNEYLLFCAPAYREIVGKLATSRDGLQTPKLGLKSRVRSRRKRAGLAFGRECLLIRRLQVRFLPGVLCFTDFSDSLDRSSRISQRFSRFAGSIATDNARSMI
jgi:hypothetical protein